MNRLARRNARSPNTTSTARTTGMFMASDLALLGSGSRCRGWRFRRRTGGRVLSWRRSERQLLARLGFLVWLLAGRRARWRVVAVARVQRDRRRAAKRLERRDHRQDFLIGEANRGLVDDRHSRI